MAASLRRPGLQLNVLLLFLRAVWYMGDMGNDYLCRNVSVKHFFVCAANGLNPVTSDFHVSVFFKQTKRGVPRSNPTSEALLLINMFF